MKPIMVVGGYGAVGRYIVADLHRLLPDSEIIVAGRSLQKAQSFADTFGGFVSAVAVDLTSVSSIEAILAQSSLVILSTEVGSENAARTCIKHRLPMISVAASVSVMHVFASLQSAAKSARVALVTEVGLAPGLVNLMARQIMADLPNARSLDLVLQLAMAGDHGPEAMEWTIARSKEAGGAIVLEPPLPIIGRWVIPVDFVDRENMANEFDVETITSSLALFPTWSTRILPAIAPLLANYPRLLEKIERVIKTISRIVGLPLDDLYLVVRARADDDSVTIQLRGKNQSRVTGLVAAKTAARLISLGEGAPKGVIGMANIVTLDDLKPALEDIGCIVSQT